MNPAPRHNVRSPGEQSPSGCREVLLAVERIGRDHDTDVEGVVVRVDAREVILTLEDGERFVFDVTELRSALRAA